MFRGAIGGHCGCRRIWALEVLLVSPPPYQRNCWRLRARVAFLLLERPCYPPLEWQRCRLRRRPAQRAAETSLPSLRMLPVLFVAAAAATGATRTSERQDRAG